MIFLSSWNSLDYLHSFLYTKSTLFIPGLLIALRCKEQQWLEFMTLLSLHYLGIGGLDKRRIIALSIIREIVWWRSSLVLKLSCHPLHCKGLFCLIECDRVPPVSGKWPIYHGSSSVHAIWLCASDLVQCASCNVNSAICKPLPL